MSGEQKTAEEKRMDRCFEFAQLYADQQNAALKAALAELIPIVEERLRRIVNYDMPDYHKVKGEIKAAIERAKKLLNKQPQSESDKTE